jgi:hypothetical protein
MGLDMLSDTCPIGASDNNARISKSRVVDVGLSARHFTPHTRAHSTSGNANHAIFRFMAAV